MFLLITIGLSNLHSLADLISPNSPFTTSVISIIYITIDSMDTTLDPPALSFLAIFQRNLFPKPGSVAPAFQSNISTQAKVTSDLHYFAVKIEIQLSYFEVFL